MAGSPASTSFPLQASEPLIATVATGDSGVPSITVTFSQAITAGTLSANDFIWHLPGNVRFGNTAQSYTSGTTKTFTMAALSNAAGTASTLDYAPSGSRILTGGGTPLANFTGLPCLDS